MSFQIRTLFVCLGLVSPCEISIRIEPSAHALMASEGVSGAPKIVIRSQSKRKKKIRDGNKDKRRIKRDKEERSKKRKEIILNKTKK